MFLFIYYSKVTTKQASTYSTYLLRQETISISLPKKQRRKQNGKATIQIENVSRSVYQQNT
jgi:hypothetical protein